MPNTVVYKYFVQIDKTDSTRFESHLVTRNIEFVGIDRTPFDDCSIYKLELDEESFFELKLSFPIMAFINFDKLTKEVK
jgi:hypothetical protein